MMRATKKSRNLSKGYDSVTRKSASINTNIVHHSCLKNKGVVHYER